jgi:hypothetical protein
MWQGPEIYDGQPHDEWDKIDGGFVTQASVEVDVPPRKALLPVSAVPFSVRLTL